MAAGEEIEQPFGYGGYMYFPCILFLLTMAPDKNDLDLDFFCKQVIRSDLEDIRQISCPNSDLGVPGAVEKGSFVGHGVVVDAGLRHQVMAGSGNGAFPGADQSFSDPNATLIGRQQGTSTQDIMIMSGTAALAGVQ